MASILFVSEPYIKSVTPIGDLVQWSEIKSTAEVVQDSYIQDILGSNFYTYLQGVYSAQTLSANEVILMNHIKPAEAYRTAEQTSVFINYQLKNKGIMTQTGDYASNADLETTKFVRNELRDRAEFYAKRLTAYLCENGNLFSQYITDNSDDMSPSKGGYDGCDLAFWS